AQFLAAKPAMGNRDVALPGQLDRPGHKLEMLLENEPRSARFSPRAQLESPFAFDAGRDDPQIHHAFLAHADLLVRGGDGLLRVRAPLAHVVVVRDHARARFELCQDFRAQRDVYVGQKVKRQDVNIALRPKILAELKPGTRVDRKSTSLNSS